MILPDYLDSGLRVVFCGTAAGRISAQKGHYYAGPGNRFWPMLAQTGLLPRLFRPDEDHLVTRFGIGLTDVAKTVSGPDAQLPQSGYDPAGMCGKIAALRPRVLAFTSLTAARRALQNPAVKLGVQAPHPAFGGAQIWALPSPSGLAKSHFDPKVWHAMAQAVLQ